MSNGDVTINEDREDIYTYLLQKERSVDMIMSYMSRYDENQLSPAKRDKVVFWMSRVALVLDLLWESYFLAVNILDKYLYKRKQKYIDINLLKEFGIASLVASAKFTQITIPSIEDYGFTSSIEEKSIILAECGILVGLEWSMTITTSFAFMGQYLSIYHNVPFDGNMNVEYLKREYESEKSVSMYILGASLVEYDLVKFPNSLKAASAILIAREMLGLPLWPEKLEMITRYKESDMEKCKIGMVVAIANSVSRPDDSPDGLTKYMVVNSTVVYRIHHDMKSRFKTMDL
jgi:hypothetical protein